MKIKMWTKLGIFNLFKLNEVNNELSTGTWSHVHIVFGLFRNSQMVHTHYPAVLFSSSSVTDSLARLLTKFSRCLVHVLTSVQHRICLSRKILGFSVKFKTRKRQLLLSEGTLPRPIYCGI